MSKPKIGYGIGNSASTTLASGVTNTDTSFPLTNSSNFQAKSGEGMVKIDEGLATEEIAYATGISAGALTIPLANRGLEGGSSQAHAAGATIRGILSAGLLNDVSDSIANVLDPVTGDIDYSEFKAAFYAADAGSTDAYAITLSPVPATLAPLLGLPISFKANTANTGAATLNVNSIGAQTIKKAHDQDLADNDIEVGQIVTVVWDGTNFQMQSQIANSATGPMVDAGAYVKPTTDGDAIREYDSGGTKYLEQTHDGTDAKITGSSGHIVLTPATSKLIKTAVLRQDHNNASVTNTYKNNQVILVGWSAAVGTGAQSLIFAPTWGITFADTPWLQVGLGGYKDTTAPTSLADTIGLHNLAQVFMASFGQLTTTGVNLSVLIAAGQTVPSSRYIVVTWILIGTL